jgi:hypothetical protein
MARPLYNMKFAIHPKMALFYARIYIFVYSTN